MNRETKITSLASSSKANCHLVQNGVTKLLLDAGLKIKRLRQHVNPSELSAVLVSHKHFDHCRGVADLLKAAVDCYMLQDVADELGVSGHHRVKIITQNMQFTIANGITVYPFVAEHDVPTVGFYISSGDNRILYLTDTAFVRPRFAGLTHVMIECNYDMKTLNESCPDGFKRQRIIKTHFGLDNVVQFFQDNDLRNLQEVHLLHLSNDNANEAMILGTLERILPPGVLLTACKE